MEPNEVPELARQETFLIAPSKLLTAGEGAKWKKDNFLAKNGLNSLICFCAQRSIA